MGNTSPEIIPLEISSLTENMQNYLVYIFTLISMVEIIKNFRCSMATNKNNWITPSPCARRNQSITVARRSPAAAAALLSLIIRLINAISMLHLVKNVLFRWYHSHEYSGLSYLTTQKSCIARKNSSCVYNIPLRDNAVNLSSFWMFTNARMRRALDTRTTLWFLTTYLFHLFNPAHLNKINAH